MRTGLVLAATSILLLLTVEQARGREIAREPLDRLWEEHMLSGTSAVYSDGTLQEYTPERSFEPTVGMPSSAAFTKQGIVVSDLRATRLLGLWAGGGWELQGGLIGGVERRDSTVELYAKEVVWTEPFFILNLKAMHTPKQEFSYEFFLLHRRRGAPRAAILEKWTFRPEQLRLKGDAYPDIRGFLRFDPSAVAATIVIEGLKDPFEVRVDLSRVLGK